jgi:hypothetical protein
MASQYANNDGCNSMATGGFHLAFSRSKDKVYVTSSVQSFTAVNYAKAVKEKFNGIFNAICKPAA